MKMILPVAIIIIFLVFGYLFITKRSSNPTTTGNTQVQTDNNEVEEFVSPKKSAHYESNTPAHGAILAAMPINVVIDFNFDLAKPSAIKIENSGRDYGVGETIIETNKLSMRRVMDAAAPDGTYTVLYNACWPDGSCHDGSFQFSIKRDDSASYINMTNKKEVMIRLKDIIFDPKDVIVSAGTKITWINDDVVEHYVNTDSHPAHTYYKDQNSRGLKQGDTYSITLDTPGIYPYHCSAHADSMIGSIIVQ